MMVICYKPTEYQATPDGGAVELVRKAAAACGPWIREPMEGEADSDKSCRSCQKPDAGEAGR